MAGCGQTRLPAANCLLGQGFQVPPNSLLNTDVPHGRLRPHNGSPVGLLRQVAHLNAIPSCAKQSLLH